MTNHRIRVLLAGDVYANRALVRPFLEDDGYEVAAEVFERTDLIPGVIREQPDAVVIDEAILARRRGGKTLQRLRHAAPESKLVVLTATPGATAFAEADATLQAGLSLAALSALLGRLFAEAGASARAGALTASTGGAGTTPGVVADATANPAAVAGSRGSVARFIASVGLPLVVVWSLIALLTTGGRALLNRNTPNEAGESGVVAIPLTDGPLQGAQDALDHLLHAIRAGNPVLATVHAQALMDARASARSLGYPIDGLDSDVESSLSAVMSLLSPAAVGALSGILDGLFPQTGGQAGTGSGLLLGPTATSAGGADVVLGGLGGGGGDAAGGDGEAQGVGDGSVGHDADEGELGPGDGRAWGRGHNHADEPGEDSSGGAELHGYSHLAPGHDEDHHPHGHAWGHQKHWGHGDGVDRGGEAD